MVPSSQGAEFSSLPANTVSTPRTFLHVPNFVSGSDEVLAPCVVLSRRNKYVTFPYFSVAQSRGMFSMNVLSLWYMRKLSKIFVS